MRTIKRVLDSTASPDDSPWVRINNMMEDYSIGFIFHPHTGATGSYSIQVSLSNPEEFQKATYTRVTTTLTITLVDHGLVAGDDVNLQGTPWDQTGGNSIPVVTVPDADTITVTVADTGPASGGLKVAPIRVEDLDDFSGVTGRQKGNTVGAIQLMRAAVAGGTFSGKGTLEVTQSY